MRPTYVTFGATREHMRELLASVDGPTRVMRWAERLLSGLDSGCDTLALDDPEPEPGRKDRSRP